MNPKSSTVFFHLAVLSIVFTSMASAASAADDDDNNPIVNGSNYWVVKIAEEACKPGNHNDADTAKIFRCYFEIPKTQTFLNCQYKTFGHFLDSERNMDDFCARWNETFVYYACNQKAFADAGLSAELPAVVEKLNLCQAKVLKLGQFAGQPARPQLPGHLGQLLSLLQGLIGQHGGAGMPMPMPMLRPGRK